MHFIPPFNFHDVFIEPWTSGFSLYAWILAMGVLVGTACGLVGNYLLLRRMALVGDAISHSVLPGLVVAFLIAHSRNIPVMFAGALAAGLVTVFLIEFIHKKTRVKTDAAICVSFTSLFAIGVVLTNMIDKGGLHIDAECILYGEIALVPLAPVTTLFGHALGPQPVIQMLGVTIGVILLIVVFYKELLVSSFDSALTTSLGFNATALHYGLMAVLSIVVVSAFEAVGAVMVVAMLIIPGMTAAQISSRLPIRHWLVAVHSLLSSLLGLHLSIWLNCSMAGAMVVSGAGLFVIAWVFTSRNFLTRRWLHRQIETPEPATASSESAFL